MLARFRHWHRTVNEEIAVDAAGTRCPACGVRGRDGHEAGCQGTVPAPWWARTLNRVRTGWHLRGQLMSPPPPRPSADGAHRTGDTPF